MSGRGKGERGHSKGRGGERERAQRASDQRRDIKRSAEGSGAES